MTMNVMVKQYPTTDFNRYIAKMKINIWTQSLMKYTEKWKCSYRGLLKMEIVER